MPKSASTAEEVTVGALCEAVAARLAASPAWQRDGGDARREAGWLVADLLGQPRGWVVMARQTPLDALHVERIRHAAERRALGEPLAYVTGRAGFRRLDLQVDARVLIPRPETEQLVDLVLERLPAGGVVVDVGTGSGAIALAVATEGAAGRIVATDASSDALAVARGNAAALGPAGAAVEWRAGSLLAPLADLAGTVDVLVSNPPYIAEPELEALPASVRDWEPALALVSGRDGLTAARELIAGAPALLREGGWLLLELDHRRVAQAGSLASDAAVYDSVAVIVDAYGRDRFLAARRAPSSS